MSERADLGLVSLGCTSHGMAPLDGTPNLRCAECVLVFALLVVPSGLLPRASRALPSPA